jgi:hypothetical protein
MPNLQFPNRPVWGEITFLVHSNYPNVPVDAKPVFPDCFIFSASGHVLCRRRNAIARTCWSQFSRIFPCAYHRTNNGLPVSSNCDTAFVENRRPLISENVAAVLAPVSQERKGLASILHGNAPTEVGSRGTLFKKLCGIVTIPPRRSSIVATHNFRYSWPLERNSSDIQKVHRPHLGGRALHGATHATAAAQREGSRTCAYRGVVPSHG